ncbi:hypothetical protein [Thermococcus sp. LS1]|uniref:hypothetical protein n=1 Tax=Thermococcus sp. LS1 TaxID=1638259 RepID=UPI001F0D7D43|nr:hypothetical protein [Thermococcus sp. LS1]
MAHAKVPAYDKLTRRYVDIEIAQTYPIKIHSTGKYTIWESPTRGIYFTESQGNNPPRITTTPNIWSISKEAEWRRKWISAGSWKSAVYVRQSQSEVFSSSSSLSIPIGYAAGKYLAGINPTLGRLASALSLTFGFHKYMNAASMAEYSVDVKPKKRCYAMYSVLGVKVRTSGPKISVPLVFGVITDGRSPSPPCDPRTGMCVNSDNDIIG